MHKLISLTLSLLMFLAVIVYADVSVTPYGAAGTVSGSCFLLDADGQHFIIDCGLFMSEDECKDVNGQTLKESRNLTIPQELTAAKAIFLTHAHLDHSGRIPLLIHKGFHGKIYSTSATKELTLALFKERNGFDLIKRKWFWSESQYEKAENRSGTVAAHWRDECKKSIKSIGYSKDEMLLKDLGRESDVEFLLCKNCCELETEKIAERFVTLDYNEKMKVSEDIKVKFINAGHIPGSSSIIFNTNKEKVIFSGDIGSGYSKFNGEFEIPESSDLVFMEATYGGRVNSDSTNEYELFKKDLMKALETGKTVWIPAFSLNRTQEVLYELKILQDDGCLPKNIPIYSVSPSANTITSLYQKEIAKKEEVQDISGRWFSDNIYQKKSILPENVQLQMIRTYNMQMVLFSASGDMDKGKSAQLASTMLSDKNVFIMIVNYVDPKSSTGLLLRNKKPHFDVKKIAAKIKKYNTFSDHADFVMLQKWLSKQNKDSKIYIIHSNRKNTKQAVNLLRKKGWTNVNSTKLGKAVN